MRAVNNAYAALYGYKTVEPIPNHTPKEKTSSRALKCPTEQQEQFVLAAWLRQEGIPHHHSPNGGYRDLIEAAKFKRLGTSAGFPDIFIPKARKGFHGLYIELKRLIGGTLSESQKEWRDILQAEGYAWYLARGSKESIEIIKNYLDTNETRREP